MDAVLDGHGGGHGGTDAPGDQGGSGSVWSGDIRTGSLVPPAPPGVTEGHA